MLGWILVPVGGAFGALSRYAAERAIAGVLGPTVLGTFFVNITGSFLLGLLLSVLADRVHIAPEWRLFVAVGFLGSYTTFSTVTVATIQLAEDGALVRAAVNILGSIVVGLIAAFLGLLAGRAL